MQTRTIRHIIEGQELLSTQTSSSVAKAAKLIKKRRVGVSHGPAHPVSWP